MLTGTQCRQRYPGGFRLSRATTTAECQSCNECRPRTPACQTNPKMFSIKNLLFCIRDYPKSDKMKTITSFLEDIRSWLSDDRFFSFFLSRTETFCAGGGHFQWFIDVNTWRPTLLVFQVGNFCTRRELEFVKWEKFIGGGNVVLLEAGAPKIKPPRLSSKLIHEWRQLDVLQICSWRF